MFPPENGDRFQRTCRAGTVLLPHKMNQDEPERKKFAFAKFQCALSVGAFCLRGLVLSVPLTCPEAQLTMPLPNLSCSSGPGIPYKEDIMSDWHYAQTNQEEELANLHFFSMKKTLPAGEVYFRITIKEFAVPPRGMSARFFAEADKQVNQKIAPVVPFGFGESLRGALSECMKMIRQFPYDGEEQG
jgi:hypothetical protein